MVYLFAEVFVDMLTFNRFRSFNVIFYFAQCCTYERFYRLIINVPSSEAFYYICVGAIVFLGIWLLNKKKGECSAIFIGMFPGKVNNAAYLQKAVSFLNT